MSAAPKARPECGSVANLPDFLIIGAPKCGTTTLYRMLRGHADVAMPRKEPGFLSQDVERTNGSALHVPDAAAYRAIFAARPPGTLAGEATPRTLYSAAALEAMDSLLPRARAITVLRNPADLVVSYHAQKLKEGVEREADFAAALARCLGPDGRPLSDAPMVNGGINYWFWGRIGTHLSRWSGRLGDRLLMLTLSEMEADLAAVYLRLLAFLGLPDDGRRDFPVANERVAIRGVRLHRAAIGARRAALPLLRTFGRLSGGRSTGLLAAVNRFTMAPAAGGTAVDAPVRARLEGLFAHERALAEAILGRPL